MKITKFGHCCLLIEEKGKKILTDPGTYTTQQNTLTGIDIILITHEHQDHFHIDSVKEVLKNNPKAQVVTNAAVGLHLQKEGITFQQIGDGEKAEVAGILIEGFGKRHAEIYKEIGQVENTSYFINEKLFYPGDAYYNPQKPVDILLLPVGGPWCKVKDVIDYALAVHPRIAIPVHDAGLKTPAFSYRTVEMVLSKEGITFVALEIEQPQEI